VGLSGGFRAAFFLVTVAAAAARALATVLMAQAAP